jgi:hypothetical protein
MTIYELIKALSHYDGDMEVRISQPTHNYWHEIQAQTIDYVDEGFVGNDEMLYDSFSHAIDNSGGYFTAVVIRG